MNSPSWTDILQALAAAAGAIFLIVNFIYLRLTYKQQAKQLELSISTSKDELIPRFEATGNTSGITYSAKHEGNWWFVINIKNIAKTARKVEASSFIEEILLYRAPRWGASPYASSTVLKPIISPGESLLIIIVIKDQPEFLHWFTHFDLELKFTSELDICYKQLIHLYIKEGKLTVLELTEPVQTDN